MYRDEATFYRAALLLGLVRGEAVVAWSDAVLAGDPNAPHAFVEVASTPPADLSAMRHALYPLCDDRESPVVIGRMFALVGRDLDSARRSFGDTMTVLLQMRKFLKLDPATDEAVKTLTVQVWQAKHHLGCDAAAAEQQVRDFLRRHGDT